MTGDDARARPGPAGPGWATRIAVRARFEPETLVVPAHVPIRIVFTRHDSAHCSDEVVFPNQGVHADLSRDSEVAVELPGLEPGEYGFECGLRVLRGRLIVH